MGPISRTTGRTSRALRLLPVVLILTATVAADTSALSPADGRLVGQTRLSDVDGDGITDRVEISGWRTPAGRVFITDPGNPDTDGDGLTDAVEAGQRSVGPAWTAAYAGLSDPTSVDSDGDGLDDATEIDGESGAWVKDSDDDGLDDFDEIEFGSDPLTPNADGDHLNDMQEMREGGDPNVYDLTNAQAAGAFAGAFTAGSWTWLAKHVGRLNDQQLDSWQYLVGSTARGFLPLADLTDVAADLSRGEWAAVLVGLVAIIPVLGDSAKITAAVVNFAKKGGAATRAAVVFVSKNPALSSKAKAEITGKLARLNAVKGRLPQDAAVRGTPAPARLPLTRPISKSAIQNALKDEKIVELQKLGYKDIRVNQQQVNAAGERVGKNRPDIQATAPDGTRHYFEFDTVSSNRGPAHQSRILSNDDTANVCLLSEKDSYQTCA